MTPLLADASGLVAHPLPEEPAYPDVTEVRDGLVTTADATFVALAEATGQRTILTLDDGFRVYRVRRGRGHASFQIVPGD